jgi:putative component of membrane protein insertase Oxa1/YidC/SpoIIIJ protein YidD
MASHSRKALATVFWLPATASVLLLRLYQQTLSPDHGLVRHLYPHGFCRHSPTCSEFAIKELRTSLFPTACLRIAQRIFSCHPWKEPSDERLREIIEKSMK